MSTAREGFSLVEVLVSMFILVVGVLAMGASTGYVLGEVRLAGVMTDRNVAVGDVSEQLRASDWSSLESTCTSATFTSGAYSVTCEVEKLDVHLKHVRVISAGPGYGPGGSLIEIVDTTALALAEPMP